MSFVNRLSAVTVVNSIRNYSKELGQLVNSTVNYYLELEGISLYTLAVDVGGTKIAAGVMNRKYEWLSNIKQESQAASASSMYDSLLDSMQLALSQANLNKNQIKKLALRFQEK